jgi:hypothetical protein
MEILELWHAILYDLPHVAMREVMRVCGVDPQDARGVCEQALSRYVEHGEDAALAYLSNF